MLYLKTNLLISTLKKKVAISQSNYVPWKGYFDNIALVDEFVLYDDMQYTKRDWRNRNKIKTPNGLKWLTIPVEVKGKYNQKINETIVSDDQWNIKHLKSLTHSYAKAKCYEEVFPFIEELYLGAVQKSLSEINYYFLRALCSFLGIKTKLLRSSEYQLLENGTSSERLVDLCLQMNATDYYTGSAAKEYLNEQIFEEHNIKLHYFDYSGYNAYSQLYGNFEHGVSILDMLFNEGVKSKSYLKYVC